MVLVEEIALRNILRHRPAHFVSARLKETMRTIESELHDVLLDIAPDMHDYDEQAIIVAEASIIFERVAAKANKTASRRADAAKVHEAHRMDALLQAMGRLADWSDPDDNTSATMDAYGLEPEQIVHRASQSSSHRYSTKGFGANMDIVGDDLDIFMGQKLDGNEVDEYSIDDGEERHSPSLYEVPGLGRHRSDSRAR